MIEIVISDSLIKFHASGVFYIMLLIMLIGNIILGGLRIYSWFLDRKSKEISSELEAYNKEGE